jgi:hypothetical protein
MPWQLAVGPFTQILKVNTYVGESKLVLQIIRYDGW